MHAKLGWLFAAIAFIPSYGFAGAEVCYDLDLSVPTSNSDSLLGCANTMQFQDRVWYTTGVEQGIGETELSFCDLPYHAVSFTRPTVFRHEWIANDVWPRTRQMLGADQYEVSYETRMPYGLQR